MGILGGVLSERWDWLVDDKMTLSDRSVVPWNLVPYKAISCPPGAQIDGFRNFQTRHSPMPLRESRARTIAKTDALMDEHILTSIRMPEDVANMKEHEEYVTAKDEVNKFY